MAIHERLRTARRDAGYASAAAAAKAFGWPIGTYSCHENGSRGIKLDAAKRYARAFGVNPLWLLYGTGMESLGGVIRDSVATALQQFEMGTQEPFTLLAKWHELRRGLDSGTIGHLNFEEEMIQFAARELFGYHVDALALPPRIASPSAEAQPVSIAALAAIAEGGADASGEKAIGQVWFRREWLQSRGIEPASCVVIGVRSESTWTRLKDGDSILVDRRRTRRLPDCTFVLRVPDGLVVQRVVEHRPGDWWLQSETLHADLEPYPDDADIYGQVVWSGRVIVEPVSE